MDQPFITTETPKDSTILAYGTAPSFWNRGRLVGAGAVFVAFAALVLVGFGFSAKLPVTARTLLIVARPTVAQRVVSPDLRRTLPLSWQKALEGSSTWPVLLGAGLGPNGWEWFAVVPRTRKIEGLATKSAGLARIVYDQELVQPTEHVSYGQALRMWISAPWKDAAGQFALGSVSASSSLVTFTYHDHLVQTSLRFEHHPASFMPRQADLSLDLSSLTGLTRDELLNELPVPGFARFPSLQEVHLAFREHGSPEAVQLVHTEALTRAQTTQVLAGFGVTAKRIIQLGDGSLATELTSPSGDMTQPVRISPRDTLLVQDREIRYGSSTELLAKIPFACESAKIAGRISAIALQKLAQSIGFTFDVGMLHGWQLGEAKDGSMVMCEEK